MKILLLTLEFGTWRSASHWPYPMNLGLEEGLKASGADVVTIPVGHEHPGSSRGSWLSRAREICAGHRFDQVWFEICHSNLDASSLAWIAQQAPVRVAFVVESMRMSAEERAAGPEGCARREAWMRDRLPYATHVLAVDELDVARLEADGTPAYFWPAGVMPARMIRGEAPPPRRDEALFLGTVYGARAEWLAHPALQGLLFRPEASPEWATPLPAIFDELQRSALAFLAEGTPDPGLTFFGQYLDALRRCRRSGFELYLDGLQEGIGVVNLPQFGQAYASRVTEAMAAGRPVLSWSIPDRPRTRALFEDGKEILLYDQHQPEQLAEHVERLRREPGLGRSIAAAARARLRAHHASERVLPRVVAWAAGAEARRVFPSGMATAEPASGGIRRILEVGCGDGQAAVEQVGEGQREVVGLERRGELATLARGRLTAVYAFDVETLPSLPYPAGYFDEIRCPAGIEYWLDPVAVLGHLRRWLAPAGRLACGFGSARRHSVLLPLLLQGRWDESGALEAPPRRRTLTVASAKALLGGVGLLADGDDETAETASSPPPALERLAQLVAELGGDRAGFLAEASSTRSVVYGRQRAAGRVGVKALPNPWQGSRQLHVLLTPDLECGGDRWERVLRELAEGLSAGDGVTLGIALPGQLLEQPPVAVQQLARGAKVDLLLTEAPTDEAGWERLLGGTTLWIRTSEQPRLLALAKRVGVEVQVHGVSPERSGPP